MAAVAAAKHLNSVIVAISHNQETFAIEGDAPRILEHNVTASKAAETQNRSLAAAVENLHTMGTRDSDAAVAIKCNALWFPKPLSVCRFSWPAMIGRLVEFAEFSLNVCV